MEISSMASFMLSLIGFIPSPSVKTSGEFGSSPISSSVWVSIVFIIYRVAAGMDRAYHLSS
uniref:Uncharacterized protein n=1 Tax=uncultured marine virus TaxID=186617 RepID=A0A0F7L1R5_9VIRU|nr:hypothetical protein [uncultured marine virus]